MTAAVDTHLFPGFSPPCLSSTRRGWDSGTSGFAEYMEKRSGFAFREENGKAKPASFWKGRVELLDVWYELG